MKRTSNEPPGGVQSTAEGKPSHTICGTSGTDEVHETMGSDQAPFRSAAIGTRETAGITKPILMIAYHYPPCSVSSGMQRTLSFSRRLPAHGWNPMILSAHPRAYARISDDQLSDIPDTVPVKRAFALDTTVHFAFRGRYFNWMALPDRWVSWLVGAIPAGLQLIRKHKPQVLWSTYPIATAHLIGFILHQLTGIPWVADFRDPMVEIDPVTKQQWPLDPTVRVSRLWVERLTIKHCCRAVFAAPGALRIYVDRYADVSPERFVLIPNGYEEESFRDVESRAHPASQKREQIVLLHSGVLYPSPDRHPGAFFSAISALRRAGTVSPSNLKVILRASSNEDGYRALLHKEGIDDIVYLEPAISYREALAEMLTVDGLLVFQGHDSNPAIPAKLYEYFRARRPIFAMADAEGDTVGALRSAGVGKIVPLDRSERIAEGLAEFFAEVRAGKAPTISEWEARRYSREARTEELARLLDSVVRSGLVDRSLPFA